MDLVSKSEISDSVLSPNRSCGCRRNLCCAIEPEASRLERDKNDGTEILENVLLFPKLMLLARRKAFPLETGAVSSKEVNKACSK